MPQTLLLASNVTTKGDKPAVTFVRGNYVTVTAAMTSTGVSPYCEFDIVDENGIVLISEEASGNAAPTVIENLRSNSASFFVRVNEIKDGVFSVSATVSENQLSGAVYSGDLKGGVGEDYYISPVSQYDKALFFAPPPRQPNAVRGLSMWQNDLQYCGGITDSEVYETESGAISVGQALTKSLQMYASKFQWDLGADESLLIQARIKTVGQTTANTNLFGNSDGSVNGISLALNGPTSATQTLRGRMVFGVRAAPNSNQTVTLNPVRYMTKSEVATMLGGAPAAWVLANSYTAGSHVTYTDTEYYIANAAIPANTPFTIGTSLATWRKVSGAMNTVILNTDTYHNVSILIDGRSKRLTSFVNGEVGANSDGSFVFSNGDTKQLLRNFGIGSLPTDTSFTTSLCKAVRFQALRIAVFPVDVQVSNLGLLDFKFNKNPSVLFTDADYVGA